jgi:hypothetical protein
MFLKNRIISSEVTIAYRPREKAIPQSIIVMLASLWFYRRFPIKGLRIPESLIVINGMLSENTKQKVKSIELMYFLFSKQNGYTANKHGQRRVSI